MMIPETFEWPFQKWAIDIIGLFPEEQGRKKFLIVVTDYFTQWIEEKPVAIINAAIIKKFILEFIICHFGFPMNVVSDNGTQFTDQRIRAWLAELNISQTFTYVAHPQGNSEVERANHSIADGKKMMVGRIQVRMDRPGHLHTKKHR
ncbi:uncharacterized protein LOC143563320 [Bidens hawaiensis]|uniref:uncharacterized protein LOC143563320 n=1 Tax=Bidens hawaiensis TaxID=980011 RepID=UPI0040490AF1